MGARLLFRDAAGRELTTEDLQGVSGKVRWEVVGADSIPAEASRLHQEGGWRFWWVRDNTQLHPTAIALTVGCRRLVVRTAAAGDRGP